ncbi:MAG: Na+/H+ antiporter NhaA [Rubricoccaceae bacterium]|nr:Na+/H+ antiporter NhaA [Rubricoccaceae bacterium]
MIHVLTNLFLADAPGPRRARAPRPVRAFVDFFRTEVAGGVLLFACAAVALVWANSPSADAYFALWRTEVTVGGGPLVIAQPLLRWINDGLMVLFFFILGLEIKREVLGGELASPKKAALAMAGAVGGMVGPAGLYLALTLGDPARVGGWGIPMATGIAFALGVVALLGPRVPLALKVFLTALAIVDDLGVVLVIALFYTDALAWGALGWAAAFFVALVVLNRMGVQWVPLYALLGLGLWAAMLDSGVHATIAGVLAAMTIPATRRIDTPRFLDEARAHLARVADGVRAGRAAPSAAQQDAIYALERACERAETPLQRVERRLHRVVALFVMPLFALANAGVALGGGGSLTDAAALGIMVGLVVGKPLGVFGAAWLAVRVGWAQRPAGVSWRQLFGVSLLTGIGFAMGVFIATLAFDDPVLLDSAKLGVLVASVLAGVAGYVLLRRSAPRPAPVRAVSAEAAA